MATTAPAHAGQIYSHGSLTLHNGPGDKFAPLRGLEPGTRLDVLWCNAADWCLLQAGDAQGWVPLARLQSSAPAFAATVEGDGSTKGAGAAHITAAGSVAHGQAAPASAPSSSNSPGAVSAAVSQGGAAAAVSATPSGVSVNVNVH